jgi:hypothetical protein
MTDDPTPRRLYDEEEIRRILERATELQRDEPTGLSRSRGMDLAELEEIAREAGIDPAHLRRAARELDTRTGEEGPWDELLGGPVEIILERTLPGEIGEDDFETLAFEIQRAYDTHGQPSLLGRTLTWQAESASKTRSLTVVVASRGGETTIRIEERLHQFASGLFVGTIAGMGGGVGVGVGVPVGTAVLGSALFAVAFPVGVIGLTYVGVRAIYRHTVARRRRVLEDLLERLTLLAETAVRDRLENPKRTPELPPG